MRAGRSLKVFVAAMMSLAAIAPAAMALDGQGRQGSASPASLALDYLRGRQQSDGGFAEPGSSSSDQLTAWAVLAIAAAGEAPDTWQKSGISAVDFLATRVGGLTKLTDVEKMCLAVSAAGEDPRSFAGRDLVADILGHAAADGHVGDLVNEHCWAVLALVGAGEALPAGALEWLLARQNIDGGFGYAADSGSDPDDTGAALQAIIAAGEDPASNAVSRATSYLAFCQTDNGGFAWPSAGPNVGSTAWCAQGIAATGEDPDSADWEMSGKTPLDYLRDMQQPDGHFKYSTDADTHPAWMTAECIPALEMQPFPLVPNLTDQTTVEPDPAADTEDTTVTTTTTTTTSTTTGDTSQAPDSQAASDRTSSGSTPGNNGSRARSRAGTNDATGTDNSAKAVARLQAGKGGTGGVHGVNLPAFVVFCLLYLVILGLVYLGLALYFGIL